MCQSTINESKIVSSAPSSKEKEKSKNFSGEYRQVFHVEDNGPALTVIEKRWHKDVLYTWYKEEWQADFTIGIKSTTFPEHVQSGENFYFNYNKRILQINIIY